MQTSPAEQPVEILNPNGQGNVLILCEHASNHIPDRYCGLGLGPDEQQGHIAWDPGALAISKILSSALDAPLVASKISRLVYDCNRPPAAASAIPAKSEIFEIPGNVGLSPTARQERVTTAYQPFLDSVAAVLAPRLAKNHPTAVVTIHSFTPIYFGKPRAVEIGLLHDKDRRLADAMLANQQLLQFRRLERNQPYGPEDGVTHSLQIHAIDHGLANVMIEVRNDLLKTDAAVAVVAEELLTLLIPALADL
jgi:predicted N-formylglutamate amidohydrolase